MEKQDIGWTIVAIHLELVGEVPGVTADEFTTFAENAKKGCPISRALGAVPSITMSATLR
ncbi:MAG: peroxiredoxin, partial [Polyangiales bacterium]